MPTNRFYTFKSLSAVANNVFGISEQEVKQYALSLFENGFISYPMAYDDYAYTNDKNNLLVLLTDCKTQTEIEISTYSNEALKQFDLHSEALFIDDERSHLLGAVSAILPLKNPKRSTVTDIEYALYVLILTQTKCCFLDDSFTIDLKSLVLEYTARINP